MRLLADLQQPEAQPACPQCGHDQDTDSQRDRGQQRQFVEFARSQVMSHMEHYASLSGDRSDERNRNFYQVIQQQDAQHRDGEGMMQVMRLAKNGLEICPCRQLIQDPDHQDTDGCYRCIRTFHLQHRGLISRERGITLLTQLIASGEQRLPQRDLAAINPHSLFGSMLEKKFVDVLQAWVVEHAHGKWESTIIRGNQGFRFALPETERWWELALQPTLGPAQGVAMASQPDFLLHSDDDRIKPVAIFTDGFQYHCHPVNRLADDMQKRRAILASGHYDVWNITWDDLHQDTANQVMVCHEPVAQWVQKFAQAIRGQGNVVPDASRMLCNGLQQLQAFLLSPHAPGWTQLATFAAFYPLQMLAAQRTIATDALQAALHLWSPGDSLPSPTHTDGGE